MNSLVSRSVNLQKSLHPIICFSRYLRNAPKRVTALKTLKDFKVKNVADIEDFEQNVDYRELFQRIKDNDLEIEETFTKGEDLETVVSESANFYDEHNREEKDNKRFIKKKIIGRKYFNEGKETNLLTHAAKEQIRYLHKINPTEWTPETLAKSFPISVPGVKKLLKSNFVLTSPEKIKAHDEDVRKKWDMLLSGMLTKEISFLTLYLWDAGKLQKENYNGNSRLPMTVPETKPVTVVKEKEVGEYAAIVQKYVKYKAKQETDSSEKSENLEPSQISTISKYQEPSTEFFNYVKKSKYFIDNVNNMSKFKNQNDVEVPLGQFKQNLKDELKFKSRKSSTTKQYYEWIKEDSAKHDTEHTDKVVNNKAFFSKISKYNKETIDVKIGKSSGNSSFYMYDDKLGYQHPEGHTRKGKIRVPAHLRKKSSVIKVGQCVYDQDGELLYKIPQ